MADIVNLNQFRKKRDRQDSERRGAENRKRTGVAKAERRKSQRELAKAKKDLDGKRLD